MKNKIEKGGPANGGPQLESQITHQTTLEMKKDKLAFKGITVKNEVNDIFFHSSSEEEKIVSLKS